MAQQQIPKGVCIYQKSMTASANKVKKKKKKEYKKKKLTTMIILGHSILAFKAYIRIVPRERIIS